jgi:glucan 1,3-beta-glucosidase
MLLTNQRYYQPSPNALVPFSPIVDRFDPNFAVSCAGKAASCNMAWGLRVLSSVNVLVYGAGLYSFFNNYDTSTSASSLLDLVQN